MGTIERESAATGLVLSVGAVLLVSPDAARLAEFYRGALGLALEDEVHECVPLHYACDLGDVHFTIHPSCCRTERMSMSDSRDEGGIRGDPGVGR